MRLFFEILIVIFLSMIITNCRSIPKEIEYNSFDIPLMRQTNKPSAGVKRFDRRIAVLYTGEYYLKLDGDSLLLTRRNKSGAMILRPLGKDFNLFSYTRSLDIIKEKQHCCMVIHGSSPWTNFLIKLWLFRYNPGLIHYRIELAPKEQYEAWIYISEFCYYTLLTLKDSLPPFLPAGIITEYPSAYETVKRNRLDIYIPIEDTHNGWDVWGTIGYPVVDIQGAMATFSGIRGMLTPAYVTGCSKVFYKDGTPVNIERFGKTLCFTAEGGETYILKK